jgi:hypothetical protein
MCRRLRHLPTRREIPPRSSALVTIVTCLGTIDERRVGGSSRRCRHFAAGKTRRVYGPGAVGRRPRRLARHVCAGADGAGDRAQRHHARRRRSRGRGALRRSSRRRPRRQEHVGVRPQRELWRQTWGLDAGNYFALEGNVVEGAMELICESHDAPERDVVSRMRVFDVAADSPAWTWGALSRSRRDVRGALAARRPARRSCRRACAGRTP